MKPVMTRDGPNKVWLYYARSTPIKRHVKVQGEANPYDPTYEAYFEERGGLTCWKRFGVPALFAISGMNNVDYARSAIQKSLGSRPGACITASPVCWAVPLVPRTAFSFIPSAMTGFIVSVFPFRNRVSFKEAFEGLELGEGKLSRPVLRRPGGRKAAWLLGNTDKLNGKQRP